jgi:hypothetical protein
MALKERLEGVDSMQCGTGPVIGTPHLDHGIVECERCRSLDSSSLRDSTEAYPARTFRCRKSQLLSYANLSIKRMKETRAGTIEASGPRQRDAHRVGFLGSVNCALKPKDYGRQLTISAPERQPSNGCKLALAEHSLAVEPMHLATTEMIFQTDDKTSK